MPPSVVGQTQLSVRYARPREHRQTRRRRPQFRASSRPEADRSLPCPTQTSRRRPVNLRSQLDARLRRRPIVSTRPGSAKFAVRSSKFGLRSSPLPWPEVARRFDDDIIAIKCRRNARNQSRSLLDDEHFDAGAVAALADPNSHDARYAHQSAPVIVHDFLYRAGIRLANGAHGFSHAGGTDAIGPSCK